MLYNVDGMGYFSRVKQISRGPWFKKVMQVDDGLEYYYVYQSNGEVKYLLTNNMSTEDRIAMERLYFAHQRTTWLCYAGSIWLGAESVLRMPYFRGMAYGWKFLSVFACGFVYNQFMNMYASQTHGPLLSAYLRKYSSCAKADMFDITDRKREFYEIDTSQYMDYTVEDFAHEHTSFGPQPDGEQQDASWLTEMDKFLNGKENNLKQHANFMNYDFKFKDKSFPSQEMASDLIRGKHHHEIQ